jgi:hypothetical protein
VTCACLWIPLPTQGNTWPSVLLHSSSIGLDVRMPQQSLNPTFMPTPFAHRSLSVCLPTMRLYPVLAHTRHRTSLPTTNPSVLDPDSHHLLTKCCRVSQLLRRQQSQTLHVFLEFLTMRLPCFLVLRSDVTQHITTGHSGLAGYANSKLILPVISNVSVHI